jgi:pimeloyl-ACP methyl ester carboxylesterase
LDFCTSPAGLGLSYGESLFPFAYDWRQDLIKSAFALAALIERVPAPVFVVAHSMGGLISRLLLNMDIPAAKRVRGIFQIACPVDGSSTAFLTLKRRPSFGLLSDPLWTLFHYLNPGTRARLMNALGNMHSIYQLLPPLEQKILLQSAGVQHSALHPDAWDFRDQCMLEPASRAHRYLVRVPPVPIKSVYSTDLATDWLLAVDRHWNPVGSRQKADGDGTVTSASASARSNDTVAVHGSNAEHTRVCSRKDVHETLRAFLS